jgi:hypothetical protein
MSTQAQLEREQTKILFYKINAIALGVPIFALAIIYSYSLFFDVILEKRDWRTIFFVIWLGTILVLVREGFSKFLVFRRNTSRRRTAGQTRGQTRGSRIDAWEGRNTVRLGKDLFLAAFILPFFSIAIVYSYCFIFDVAMERRHWKLVVLCVWIGVLLSLGRLGLRAGKRKISY